MCIACVSFYVSTAHKNGLSSGFSRTQGPPISSGIAEWTAWTANFRAEKTAMSYLFNDIDHIAFLKGQLVRLNKFNIRSKCVKNSWFSKKKKSENVSVYPCRSVRVHCSVDSFHLPCKNRNGKERFKTMPSMHAIKDRQSSHLCA